MVTIIIGKNSNLSNRLHIYLKEAKIYSSRELLRDIHLLDVHKNKKINIIFNNFQSSVLLKNITSFTSYINQSITTTAKVLDYIESWNVNKIIYTSSSSVYGNNGFCDENDSLHPKSLHASLKISNEFLISEYWSRKKIDYTIIRIFNMFGGDDEFSIIAKILFSYKEKKKIKIINQGKGIRDFIHVDDVAYIVSKLIKMNNIPILNIGTGHKESVEGILKIFEENNLPIKQENIQNSNEIAVSISNNTKVLSIMDKNFIKVKEYILERIKGIKCVE